MGAAEAVADELVLYATPERVGARRQPQVSSFPEYWSEQRIFSPLSSPNA